MNDDEMDRFFGKMRRMQWERDLEQSAERMIADRMQAERLDEVLNGGRSADFVASTEEFDPVEYERIFGVGRRGASEEHIASPRVEHLRRLRRMFRDLSPAQRRELALQLRRQALNESRLWRLLLLGPVALVLSAGAGVVVLRSVLSFLH